MSSSIFSTLTRMKLESLATEAAAGAALRAGGAASAGGGDAAAGAGATGAAGGGAAVTVAAGAGGRDEGAGVGAGGAASLRVISSWQSPSTHSKTSRIACSGAVLDSSTFHER